MATIFLIKHHCKIITISLLILISFLSLYPIEKVPDFNGNDKLHHLIAYFFLALPSGLNNTNKIFLIFLFVFFGGTIEIIQPYINRNGEWLDFLANCLGIITGFSVGAVLNSWLLKFN